MKSDEKNIDISVSVVIPVYNTEKYLSQCVDSVLCQTLTNLQIILVDDGSFDNCPEMCDNYALKDSRVTVIHKENGGQSTARNVGIDMSVGKYIYFLDSDDYILDDALEKLFLTAEREKADVVFFEAKSFVDDDKENTGIKVKYELKRNKEYPVRKGLKQFTELENDKAFFVCTPLHLYKSAYLKSNNIKFSEGIIHEDELFSYEVYLNDGVFAHCHEELYMRRLRPNSTMTSSGGRVSEYRYKSFLVIFKSIDKILKKHKNENEVRKAIMLRVIGGLGVFYNSMSVKSRRKYRLKHRFVLFHILVEYGRLDYRISDACEGWILSRISKLFRYIGSALKKG